MVSSCPQCVQFEFGSIPLLRRLSPVGRVPLRAFQMKSWSLGDVEDDHTFRNQLKEFCVDSSEYSLYLQLQLRILILLCKLQSELDTKRKSPLLL